MHNFSGVPHGFIIRLSLQLIAERGEVGAQWAAAKAYVREAPPVTYVRQTEGLEA